MWSDSTLLYIKERITHYAGSPMGNLPNLPTLPNLPECWNLVPPSYDKAEWLVLGSLIMFSINCVALLVFKTRKHQRTGKELDNKILKLHNEVNASKKSASAMNLRYKELKASFHQMQKKSALQAEENHKTMEAERLRSKTMIQHLRTDLAANMDICKRKEQRLVAMTQRWEMREEELAELAVKKLLEMAEQCKRKERKLRAMAEVCQEKDDQLAAMALTLQMKKEKVADLTKLCQDNEENKATLLKLCHEKDEKLAAFFVASEHQEAVLQEKIAQELAQQLEINKLKERLSALEDEVKEKEILLMAQKEEQQEAAILQKKLTEVSSELADLKRSAASSSHSLPTAQETSPVKVECIVHTTSNGHGEETDSGVEREESDLAGSRQQTIAEEKKPVQEVGGACRREERPGRIRVEFGSYRPRRVYTQGQETTQSSGQTQHGWGRENDSGGVEGSGKRGWAAWNRRPRQRSRPWEQHCDR
ncbi:myosin-10-like isoform X3 [Anguilla rostrata]